MLACRVFATSANKETAFIKNGFSNWKNVLDKRPGFYKHQDATAYKICISKWNRQKIRLNQNEEVSILVNNDVVVKKSLHFFTS